MQTSSANAVSPNFVGEVRADELLCLPHDVRDGDGHPLLAFLEQPSMELVLHSFELAYRTGAQAQALARDLHLLSQLNDLSAPPGEYIMRDLDVERDISYRSTRSLLQSKCILDNLTLLEHRVTLAGYSGRAADLSVDTRAGHLSGLSDGFDVGE